MPSTLGLKPLVVVLGSTGTGKSDLAVELAVRFNGEIINADAMQMYNGMDIATNKISKAEQRGVPHHLLGTVSHWQETWQVGRFKKEATSIIQEIRERGKLPIVVGGTQYYIDGLLFENHLVNESGKVEPEGELFSDAGNEQSQNSGEEGLDMAKQFPILDGPTEEMLDRLREVDPVMADRWQPKDRRKIRRSLEIFLTTGKRASDIYAEQRAKKALSPAKNEDRPNFPFLLFWVYSKPTILMERLDARIDVMAQRGLVSEVYSARSDLHERLQEESIDLSKGIWQSIGFKQLEPYLKDTVGGYDEDGQFVLSRKESTCPGPRLFGGDREKQFAQCLDEMRFATRRYAKYQLRWIKHKTIPMLAEEKGLDRLYLLDSTNKGQWQETVAATAVQLTEQYLSEETRNQMPAPVDVSETAREVLTETITAGLAAAAENKNALPYRQVCSICQTTSLSEKEWNLHVQGRRHRRAVYKNKKRALVPVLNDGEKRETGVETPWDEGAAGTRQDHTDPVKIQELREGL